ncbi:MAG: ligase-associated DNA damage response exonuclease [Xanthomonadales bacterium]|nr:ligase-associated DNA damage response exonuclease [Xanthomonadales bacterium]
MQDLIVPSPAGLYCPAGDFHIDPMRPVDRAIVTHGHADHARSGSRRYWTSEKSLSILEHRLGSDQDYSPVGYGESFELGDVSVSLHPAGHILGSAQVRIDDGKQVWVVSGDYKRAPDPTADDFEPVRCDVFVTESTFALPAYRWPDTPQVAQEVLAWWEEARAADRPAVLFCYALGKAQRLLAELAGALDRPVYVHGAMVPLVDCYRRAGVALPETAPVSGEKRGHEFKGELIIAPPSAAGTPWMRRFAGCSTGFASGWMRIRGNRRRRGYDRGFVLSDHADWPGLIRTIRETGARRIICMHGQAEILVRYLNEEMGLSAERLREARSDA